MPPAEPDDQSGSLVGVRAHAMRGGQEIFQRKRAINEFHDMFAGRGFDATKQQISAQDRFPLAIDENCHPG